MWSTGGTYRFAATRQAALQNFASDRISSGKVLLQPTNWHRRRSSSGSLGAGSRGRLSFRHAALRQRSEQNSRPLWWYSPQFRHDIFSNSGISTTPLLSREHLENAISDGGLLRLLQRPIAFTNFSTQTPYRVSLRYLSLSKKCRVPASIVTRRLHFFTIIDGGSRNVRAIGTCARLVHILLKSN